MKSLVWWAGLGMVTAVLASCAPPPEKTPAGPVAPGMARIWFYRLYEPAFSRNVANVSLNGSRVGSVSAFGRDAHYDVPPGHYHMTVANYGVEPDQSKDVDLNPGQEVYAKIVTTETALSGGGGQGVHREFYTISIVPPAIALVEMAGGVPPAAAR